MTDQADDNTGRQEAADIYQERLDWVPDWVWESDIEGRLTYSNRMVESILGYTASKVTGRLIFDMIVADDLAECVEAFETAKSSGTPVHNKTFRLKCKTGPPKPVAMSCVPMLGPDKRLVGFRGISRDVTDQMALLEAERELRQTYEALIDNSPSGIFIIQGGNVVIANPTITALAGYTQEEVIGRSVWQFAHPDDLPWLQDYYNRRMVGEDTPTQYIARAITKSGETRYFDFRSTLIHYRGAPAILLNAVDITERKLAEEALRESEEKHRNLVECTNDWVWEINEKTVYTYASPRSRDLIGFEPHEVLGKTPFDFMTPDEAKQVSDAFRPYAERHQPFTLLENTLVHKDGHEVVVETSGTPILDDNGIYRGYRGIDRDITERKQASERLEKLNECFLSFGSDPMENINRLTALVGEAMGASTALYSRLEGDVLHSWGRWNAPLGFVPVDKADGHICYEVIRGAEQPLLVRNLQATPYVRTDPNVAAYALRTYLGHVVQVDGIPVGSLCCVYQRDYEPTKGDESLMGIVASAIGVEEGRRSAEAEVRESEEKYRLLFENNPLPMWVYDPETLAFLAVNDAAIDHYGYSREEFLSITIKDIRPPEDVPRLLEKLAAPVDGIDRAGFWRHTKKDGTVIDVEITSHRIEFVGRPADLVLATDVTERLRAERALQDNETLLRTFVEHTPAAVAMFDREMRYLVASKRWMTDYKLGDMGIMGLSHYEVFPEIPERWKEIHRRVLEGATEHCDEDQFPRADGTADWVRWEVRPWMYSNGMIGGVIMFTEVITERKLAEEALRESEEKYKDLVETTDTGYLIVDQEGRVTDANAEYVRLTGHRSLDEIAGYSVLEWTAPHDAERNANEFRKCFEKGFVRDLEIDYISGDGAITPIEINATVIDTREGPRILTLCRDITERRLAEQALKDSEQRLFDTVNFLPDATFAIDTQGRIVTWNRAMEELTGVRAGEVIGKTGYEYALPFYGVKRPMLVDLVLHPDPEIEKLYPSLEKDGVTYVAEVEVPLFRPGGGYIWSKATPLYDFNRNVVGAIESVRDITERKRAEEALRESEERYRLLFEHSPDMVFMIKDSLITAVNPAVERVLGYTLEEVIGRAFWEISPQYQPGGGSSRQKADEYAELVRVGPQTFDWVHQRKDGSLVFCEVNITTYTVHGEAFVQAIVRDVTERRRTEEARRRFERQVERQKRQFYRDTILSVTEGKLDIADTADIKPYLSHAEKQFDLHEASQVSEIRGGVESYLSEKGLKGDALDGFMIGVGEALANAVKHGIRGRVYIGSRDGSVWIAVADQGRGIESFILPRATLLRGFSTKPSMGLGYTIMLDVADRIILKTGEHGTTVILIKNLQERVLSLTPESLPDTWANIPD